MEYKKEKLIQISKKIKSIVISIGIFLLSYMVFYLCFDAVGIVRLPVGQVEFTQTSSDLDKIKIEDKEFTIEDIKEGKEQQLKELEKSKEDKLKEIDKLKKDIESLKSKL